MQSAQSASAYSRQSPSLLSQLLGSLGFDGLVAAHGVLTAILFLGLRAMPVVDWRAVMVFSGLISTQISLATIWSTWSKTSVPQRFEQLAWQTSALYLILLLLLSFEEPRHPPMLSMLAISLAVLSLGTWLPACILRWCKWHLHNLHELPSARPHRLQFRLADVVRWCTLLCMLLAVMVGYRDDYRDELMNFQGLLYLIMLYMAVMLSLPAGLVVILLVWLTLGEHWSKLRSVVAGLLAAGWLLLTAAAGFDDYLFHWWLLTDVVCIVSLLTGYSLRLHGWRVVRSGRPVAPSPDGLQFPRAAQPNAFPR